MKIEIKTSSNSNTTDIDFEKLKVQKEIIMNMISDWGESDDRIQRYQAKNVEGMLDIIDSILKCE